MDFEARIHDLFAAGTRAALQTGLYCGMFEALVVRASHKFYSIPVVRACTAVTVQILCLNITDDNVTSLVTGDAEQYRAFNLAASCKKSARTHVLVPACTLCSRKRSQITANGTTMLEWGKPGFGLTGTQILKLAFKCSVSINMIKAVLNMLGNTDLARSNYRYWLELLTSAVSAGASSPVCCVGR